LVGAAVLAQLVAFDLGESELKVVAGSILASAVVVVIFALREKVTRLRLVFGLIALGLFGWSIYLFTQVDIEKAKGTPAACIRTLDSLHALAQAKLSTVQTEEEAKAIGQQMVNVIENSSCKE
jgi:ABC-type enterobactin transport system permease subunit